MGPATVIPALFTSPYSSSICFAAASMVAWSVTSTMTASMFGASFFSASPSASLRTPA